MTDASVCYRAAWVFPVCDAPIADGFVELLGTRILRVGRDYRGDAEVVDLNQQCGGAALLLPGLVNAHTHLEFSSLAEPLRAPGGRLTDWIPELMQWRRTRDESPSGKSQAVRQGLRESRNAGVARIGEIATSPITLADYPSDSRSKVTAYLELIALGAAQNEEARQRAFAHLTQDDDAGPSTGLSPHAPYTVNLELLEDAIDLSQRTGAPLQMHLAETREELELIANGTGPFREMLESVGVWESADLPSGLRPADYLQRLSLAAAVIIAHGNYLERDEIAYLGEHADRLSVAFCPRTHAYFGHDAYPLRTMLDLGVNLCLGTDSRASNPDLSILNEMRQVAQCSDVSPEEILFMATRAGSLALGAPQAGFLTEDFHGPLTLLTAEPRAEPYEALLASTTRVHGLI